MIGNQEDVRRLPPKKRRARSSSDITATRM